MLVPSLLLAWVLLQERNGAPAPLRDIGPAAIEVRFVDLEGETVQGAEWHYAFEDAHGGSIEDERAPNGRRQAMRFDFPPRSSQIDPALGARGWSSGAGPRIELQEERGLLIEARRDGDWGFLWLPRDWRTTAGRAHREGEPLELELAPDWDVTVRVRMPVACRPRARASCWAIRRDRSSTPEARAGSGSSGTSATKCGGHGKRSSCA